MIQEHHGDVLAVPEGIVVHGCNARGVMGAGVAAAVRKRYPAAWEAYRNAWQARGLSVGEIVAVRVSAPDAPAKFIVNAVTQRDYGSDKHRVYVDYDAVEAAFQAVRDLALEHALAVHFPLIGCGLANGQWALVAERIERALGPDVSAHLWRWPA